MTNPAVGFVSEGAKNTGGERGVVLVVLSNSYSRGFLYETWRATVFGSNLQPAVPTVYYVDLRARFNIGDELGVLAGSAKDTGWLNDFVALPNRRGNLAGWGNGRRRGLF
jgi:hypothetical protein